MKVSYFSLFASTLLLFAPLISAWTMKSIQQTAAGAVVAASLVLTPVAVQAVDFSGDYSDPKHPNCKRQVNVLGQTAYVTGTDGTPGCPADGSGRPWKLVGKVNGDDIFVDFSPKGGPMDLEGKWETQPVPGIRWPDGNLWASKK